MLQGVTFNQARGQPPGTTERTKMSAKKNESVRTGAADAVAGLAAATVQTKVEVAHSAMLVKVGKEIITAIGKVTEKYWELITYVRKNSVGPKLVSYELGKLGFKRSRISEVKRVAYSADDVFKNYEAKLIGFDKALELARLGDGGTAELTPAGRQLVTGGTVSEDEAEAELKSVEAAGDGGSKKKSKAKSMAIKLKSQAQGLGMMAAVNWKDKLPLEWRFECSTVPGGWVVVRVSAGTSGEVVKAK